MEWLKKHWFLLTATLATAWWFFTGDTPLDILNGLINRGRRLSMSSLDDSGTVVEDVDDLVANASAILGRPVSKDAYTLARVSASEHANAGQREKAAIQRVMMNDAQAHGWSIWYVVTVGKGLGHQSGRRCASASDPYEDDLLIAEANLDGSIADETSGATRFVHKTGFASITKYQALCDRWYAESKIVPVQLDGIPNFRIFLPESAVSNG